MNDVTVVTSVTYPSPESLALVADVQYHEPYLSAALNRKFRGIVDPGFYAGFLPKPGGGMNLLITSVDGDKTAGAASVDIGEFYQVTIQHRKDISLALNAGKKYAIVLKGRYLLGEDTYQVNTASHIHAAEFVARTYTDSYQLGDGELLVCTVNIPAGVSTITQEMIDTSERINRTIGIDISDSVTSTRSDVAASSLAVKKAYDLAKSKYTAQDASTTQKGLVQLSSATNSTSEVLAATPKAVKAAYDLANGKYTAQDATTTQKGIVQLSSDTNSTSETLAATPKAVKAAYDLAAGKAPSSHTHPWNQITGVPTASLTAKGITQLSSATNSTSEVLAATPKAVKAAYDLANGKYTAQDATTAQKGIVQLSSATNSTSEVLAATPKAVKAAYDLANGKQAADATLTALAALATAADKLPYFTGVDRAALTALTSVGRAILGKTSIQSVLDYLGLGEGSALPVGVPVPWPLETPPTGWLKCNGAAFSSEMYPKLAKAYPTNKLPDLRGEFIRGWDDGRGIDAGRTLLSGQDGTSFSHYGGNFDIGSGHSINNYDQIVSNQPGFSRFSFAGPSRGDGVNYVTIRPRNIAFNYIVRAA
ncbi:tail fiber protein [Escherichia coli]|uniref:phage tail protein n=1 Tax=Escherichia coli TaxID=562 RepID=UPI0012D20DD8|nr:tail fiber protein [Escherichia coli]ECA6515433.1 phage tail protein [Salmonella enterica subsp. enterica serovar Livingstone]EFD1475838.1 phage tail protein [Escherichia coli]EFW5459671.1 phage tail protein [Escherichia coli]ELJ7511984.1 tail fiber protein [Escherichia coli]HBC1159229.1 tail fiber protein [Escherichia coli]